MDDMTTYLNELMNLSFKGTLNLTITIFIKSTYFRFEELSRKRKHIRNTMLGLTKYKKNIKRIEEEVRKLNIHHVMLFDR